MPKLKDLRVILSGIHGYGVIATRPFAKGEVVADNIDGVLRHEDEDYDDTYSLYCDGTYYYDMVDQIRWVNHSCDPNCEVECDIDENGNGWARLTAIRNIVSGEELSYDYAFPSELAEPCACGTKKCRGWIVDKNEIHKMDKQIHKQKT